nr:glycosyltransferase [Arthrobacter sp. SF27]
MLVARFVPENSVHEFVDASRQIGKTHDVILVGSAGYADPIEAKIKSLIATEPRVKWLGHVSDDVLLHGLWQNAGVYFHGHSVGGTNPALVQAMACGTPTVARDTVYNREVLGKGAVFVPPEPTRIAEACLTVLTDNDKRRELAATAFARSREHYSWESVCDKYAALLRKSVRSS